MECCTACVFVRAVVCLCVFCLNNVFVWFVCSVLCDDVWFVFCVSVCAMFCACVCLCVHVLIL